MAPFVDSSIPRSSSCSSRHRSSASPRPFAAPTEPESRLAPSSSHDPYAHPCDSNESIPSFAKYFEPLPADNESLDWFDNNNGNGMDISSEDTACFSKYFDSPVKSGPSLDSLKADEDTVPAPNEPQSRLAPSSSRDPSPHLCDSNESIPSFAKYFEPLPTGHQCLDWLDSNDGNGMDISSEDTACFSKYFDSPVKSGQSLDWLEADEDTVNTSAVEDLAGSAQQCPKPTAPSSHAIGSITGGRPAVAPVQSSDTNAVEDNAVLSPDAPVVLPSSNSSSPCPPSPSPATASDSVPCFAKYFEDPVQMGKRSLDWLDNDEDNVIGQGGATVRSQPAAQSNPETIKSSMKTDKDVEESTASNADAADTAGSIVNPLAMYFGDVVSLGESLDWIYNDDVVEMDYGCDSAPSPAPCFSKYFDDDKSTASMQWLYEDESFENNNQIMPKHEIMQSRACLGRPPVHPGQRPHRARMLLNLIKE